MNDSNFLVREIGRGRGVEERSLEIREVLREGGRRWWRQESGLQIFWEKKIAKLYLICLLKSLSGRDGWHVW